MSPRGLVALAVLTLAVLALLGCSPTLVWHGHAPDRRARAAIVARDGLQALEVDGAERGRWDEIALPLRWTTRGPVAAVRRGERWAVVGPRGALGDEHDAIGEIVVAGDAFAYAAGDRTGWRVIADGVAGPTFSALRAGSLRLVAEPRRVVYVARDGQGERAVIDGVTGPAFARVDQLAIGAKGRLIAYAAGSEGAAHVVLEGEVVADAEAVLELAVAADAPRWAALLGRGPESVLVHDREELGRAPLLMQLRVSDDGAHTACLRPEPDGSAIEVWRDGRAVARSRRVDGGSLAFVPGTPRLVVVREDTQGPTVWLEGVDSERYEQIEGPVLAPGRVGWIGRRRGVSVVAVDGEVIGEEPWAGALRLAADGSGHAYVARVGAERFVVTRRGRWPVPRLYVDTLAIDASGHHWAALVPDATARRLSIWIDGAPGAELDVDEVSAAMIAAGETQPGPAIRAIVAGELARALEPR